MASVRYTLTLLFLLMTVQAYCYSRYSKRMLVNSSQRLNPWSKRMLMNSFQRLNPWSKRMMVNTSERLNPWSGHARGFAGSLILLRLWCQYFKDMGIQISSVCFD
ncbi:uncharacterized protein [Haliotis cracherodii]|uniref:uncharacterized protein n=1 Tax=Haliotis cracherodii TaxID=6455 RepID=UPI0039EB2DBA